MTKSFLLMAAVSYVVVIIFGITFGVVLAQSYWCKQGAVFIWRNDGTSMLCISGHIIDEKETITVQAKD